MAPFGMGLRRFTEDVDILVTKHDLKKIHEELGGAATFHRLRRADLRDTQLGVRIEFLTTGDYPGDGKKKPRLFSRAGTPTGFESDGISYINLEKLVELKLASGMTNARQVKGFAERAGADQGP